MEFRLNLQDFDSNGINIAFCELSKSSSSLGYGYLYVKIKIHRFELWRVGHREL
jgi:hypothetical protein